MSDNNMKPKENVEDHSDFKLGDEKPQQEYLPAEEENKEVQEFTDEELSEFELALDADFETARENILNLLDGTDDVVERLTTLCEQMDSPRAYEVLTNMLEKVVTMNKDLIELYERRETVKKKNKERNEEEKPNQNYTQNNTIMVKSTKDILSLLKDEENKEEK